MTRRSLSALELAGFGAIVVAFVAALLALDLEPQSWGSFALLLVFLALLMAYRAWLARRERP